MNIRDIRTLKNTADQRLSSAPQAKKIVLTYAGITIGLAAVVTVVNYMAGTELSNFGGLSNIGIRSFLSAIQTFLPMVQSVLLLCLDLGYRNATLRISREQYASPRSLKMGFDRFWILIRVSLLQTCVYIGIMMLSIYLAIQFFLVTPFSREIMELAGGMTSSVDAIAMMDEATYLAASKAILPLFPIWGVVFFLLFLPVFYQYRLTSYLLIDNPKLRPFAILHKSRQLMKRNRIAMFRLDVSLWWYYLLSLVASVAGYGDMLLPLLGITLPWSETVGYFLFYGVYLVLQLVICYLFLNRVSITYALAYQSLCPKEEPENNVVLGNIFQM